MIRSKIGRSLLGVLLFVITAGLIVGAAGVYWMVDRGHSPQAVVKRALSLVSDTLVHPVSAADLDALNTQVTQLRLASSNGFREIDMRLSRLESRIGVDAAALPDRSRDTSFDVMVAAKKPPMHDNARLSLPTGDVSTLIKTPLHQPPDFPPADTSKPTVCEKGCKFDSLNKAYARTKRGGVIVVAPGIYFECLAVTKPVKIVGAIGPNGERAEFREACQGKAAFVVGASFELEGVRISDIAVPDRNGACIRLEPSAGVVRIVDIICADVEEGILGSAPDGAIIIESSLFTRIAGAPGRTHGIYLNTVGEVVIENTIIHSVGNQGHTLKLGGPRAILKSNIFAALDSHNSRALDFFGGGELIMIDNVVEQGPKSDNNDMIAFGLETSRMQKYANHISYLEGNTFIYDDPARGNRVLFNHRKLGPVILRDNRFIGLTGIGTKTTEATGNQEFPNRKAAGLPAFDAKLQSLPQPKAWQ